MARLRYNGIQTTLGAGLTSTTITFAAALTHNNGTNVPTITGSDYIPLSILSPAGLLEEIVYLTAYTAGATTGTVTRGCEGTPSANRASGDTVVQDASTGDLGGVGTGILATCSYAPSFTNPTTTSGTAADIDANLVLPTFIGPPSGKVLVMMTGLMDAGTGDTVHWLLRSGSTTVTGSVRQMTNGLSAILTYNYVNVIAVTPGTSYTWKWGWLRNGGAGTVNFYLGPDFPGTMVAMAAP